MIRKGISLRTVWLYQSVCHILFGVNVDKLHCSSSSNHGTIRNKKLSLSVCFPHYDCRKDEAKPPNPRVDMTIKNQQGL